MKVSREIRLTFDSVCASRNLICYACIIRRNALHRLIRYVCLSPVASLGCVHFSPSRKPCRLRKGPVTRTPRYLPVSTSLIIFYYYPLSRVKGEISSEAALRALYLIRLEPTDVWTVIKLSVVLYLRPLNHFLSHVSAKISIFVSIYGHAGQNGVFNV